MSEVIKVNYLNNNNANKIYVFVGNSLSIDVDKLNLLFISDQSNPIFKKIFNDIELQNISLNNINVQFVNDAIHYDDNIQSIKEKIVLLEDIKISLDEIYLFAIFDNENDPSIIFKNLTNNGKIELTRDRLVQYLLNINYDKIDTLEVKEVYSFNDIMSLKLGDYKTIERSLTQKFTSVNNTYHHIVNPFNAYFIEEFLSKNAGELVTTLNSNLLLSNGLIHNNTIYLCNAHDVLTYAISEKLSERDILQIYFPFIIKRSVYNLQELNDSQILLLENNKQHITEEVVNSFKKVSLFYDINNNDKELQINNSGIKYIKFAIHPTSSFKQSLNNIFKLIHADETIPLIKYNPGRRKEKMYKLYANRISTNGRKIPYLSKGTIFKLAKSIGKTISVAMYIQYKFDDGTIIPIICEFTNEGSVNIELELDTVLSIDTIEEVIKSSINPILSTLQQYYEQSGYNIKLFDSFYSKHLEIIQIKYYSNINIKYNIDLNKYINCISSVFNVITPTLKNGIIMRYKRVANYNKMDAIDAFIVEQINLNTPHMQIIELIVSNFELTDTKAKDKLATALNELFLERGLFENKKIKVKNNPGFLTKITQNKFENSISIEVDNINNIYYLMTLPIYINTLIQTIFMYLCK